MYVTKAPNVNKNHKIIKVDDYFECVCVRSISLIQMAVERTTDFTANEPKSDQNQYGVESNVWSKVRHEIKRLNDSRRS